MQTTPASSNPSQQQSADGRRDFDFLIGNWKVHHRRLQERLANNHEWVEFEGTLATQKVLGDLGVMEDQFLAGPGPAYHAVGMHIYDPAGARWSNWWFDGRTPSQLDPPVTGSFENGNAAFFANDQFKGKPIKVRYLWTQPSAGPHWEQAFSADGGTTWETNWTMDFTRVP